jgi:hypothetical protein
MCKQCYNKTKRDKYAVQRVININKYGTAKTPDEMNRNALCKRNRRARNKERSGFANSPEEREKNRLYPQARADRNKKLYGQARSPKEQERAREINVARSTANKKLYGTAHDPKQSERDTLRKRDIRRAIKKEALSVYGGKCECCGEARPEMLNVDHIYGGGLRQRKELGLGSGADFYLWLKKQGWPKDKYRLMCWNCNNTLGHYGYCPHKGRPVAVNANIPQSTLNGRKLKTETITAYGGKCQKCGETHWEFLTVDHVNGGGNQHRKELGTGGGPNFYRWLKKQGYPNNGYQLLCFNCNDSKSVDNVSVVDIP